MQENSTIKAELTKVKSIGDILVEANYLSDELRDKIVFAVGKGENKGKSSDVIIKDEEIEISNEILDKALLDQAQLRVVASSKDVKDLQQNIQLDFSDLAPHWGNGEKPDALIVNPTKIDAALAAANIAQLIVLLAKNVTPNLTLNAINGVNASGKIVSSIVNGQYTTIGFALSIRDWIQTSKSSLQFLGNKNGIEQDIIKEYIQNRFSDIETGLSILNIHAQNITEAKTKNQITAR